MNPAEHLTAGSVLERAGRFLYDEAHLLDEWRLDDWLELFTADARCVVPATDLPEGDPDKDLVLIDDDLGRLRGRVERLKSHRATLDLESLSPHGAVSMIL